MHVHCVMYMGDIAEISLTHAPIGVALPSQVMVPRYAPYVRYGGGPSPSQCSVLL